MIILSYIFVIKISDAEIENDGEDKGKIKNCKVNTVTRSAHFILNGPVEAQYENGLYEQVHNE